MKYTLIQTYPGYETLGITHCSENKTPEWRGTNFYDAHPTYWQKVEEVDYDITEVKYFTEIRFLHNGFYRIYKDGIGFELDYLLKHGGTIHSVKRLSDGEVFTIGDDVVVDDDGKLYEIIKLIKLTDIIQVYAKTIGREIYYRLNSISKPKVKTPLFTTEDGVEIFDKNQKVFSVSECDFKIQNHQDSAWVKTRNPERKYHHFSTYKKAAEWILFNQKLLSLNDLLSTWGNAENPETAPLFLKFEKLAKSKL